MEEGKINLIDFGRLIESVNGVKGAIETQTKTIQDLESRIDDLEKKKNLFLGMLIGSAGLGGTIGAAVMHLIGGKG